MPKKLWTREEEIIVFNLYCRIPFQRSSKSHPEVIRIANLIGRTPSAVNMKIGNFGSFDESLKAKGIVGLTNASALDKQIWDEFNSRWDELAYESEQLIAKYSQQELTTNNPDGDERVVTTKQRVNQSFFRNAILSSYQGTCCITGLNVQELLIASHIKPWRESNPSEKTNPRNGLCLNALHDKAFDRGLLTITPDYTIRISSCITDTFDGKTAELFFYRYEGHKISSPEKFAPDPVFLQYHNDVIFENWK